MMIFAVYISDRHGFVRIIYIEGEPTGISWIDTNFLFGETISKFS
jgi:hypothetical protein